MFQVMTGAKNFVALDIAQRETDRNYTRMLRVVPSCLWGALDRPRTLTDLKYAAQHEIDMFEENQDGHLTAIEIKQVRKYLAKIERIL